jgi:hypothetical protein
MAFPIVVMDSFIVSTRAAATSWNLSAGLVPSGVTDFTLAGGVATFTGTFAANANEFSVNSTNQLTGINQPISICVVNITNIPGTTVYARVSDAALASTALQTSRDGWETVGVGSMINIENNQRLNVGVFKEAHDNSVTVTFSNASTNPTAVVGTGYVFN